jgi:hypothetical protein
MFAVQFYLFTHVAVSVTRFTLFFQEIQIIEQRICTGITFISASRAALWLLSGLFYMERAALMHFLNLSHVFFICLGAIIQGCRKRGSVGLNG